MGIKHVTEEMKQNRLSLAERRAWVKQTIKGIATQLTVPLEQHTVNGRMYFDLLISYESALEREQGLIRIVELMNEKLED